MMIYAESQRLLLFLLEAAGAASLRTPASVDDGAPNEAGSYRGELAAPAAGSAVAVGAAGANFQSSKAGREMAAQGGRLLSCNSLLL